MAATLHRAKLTVTPRYTKTQTWCCCLLAAMAAPPPTQRLLALFSMHGVRLVENAAVSSPSLTTRQVTYNSHDAWHDL